MHKCAEVSQKEITDAKIGLFGGGAMLSAPISGGLAGTAEAAEVAIAFTDFAETSGDHEFLAFDITLRTLTRLTQD